LCEEVVGQCIVGACRAPEGCPADQACHTAFFGPGTCLAKNACDQVAGASSAPLALPLCSLAPDGSCGAPSPALEGAACCPIVGRRYDGANHCMLPGPDAPLACALVVASDAGDPCGTVVKPACYCSLDRDAKFQVSAAPSAVDLDPLNLWPCGDALANVPTCGDGGM
jgi:hypothetical protein